MTPESPKLPAKELEKFLTHLEGLALSDFQSVGHLRATVRHELNTMPEAIRNEWDTLSNNITENAAVLTLADIKTAIGKFYERHPNTEPHMADIARFRKEGHWQIVSDGAVCMLRVGDKYFFDFAFRSSRTPPSNLKANI